MQRRQTIFCSSNQDQSFVAEVAKTRRGMKLGADPGTVQRRVIDAMQFRVEQAQERGRPLLHPNGQPLMLADRVWQQPQQAPLQP